MGHCECMSAKALPNKSLPLARLKLLIVCEDLECGKSAKELQVQLLLALGATVQFVSEVWIFRALEHPELQDLAKKEIDEADLILFSSRGDVEVPRPISQWLETRLAEPKRPRALGGSIRSSGHSESSPGDSALFAKNCGARRAAIICRSAASDPAVRASFHRTGIPMSK